MDLLRQILALLTIKDCTRFSFRPKIYRIESFAYSLSLINFFRLLQKLSSEHMLKDNLRLIVCPFRNHFLNCLFSQFPS